LKLIEANFAGAVGTTWRATAEYINNAPGNPSSDSNQNERLMPPAKVRACRRRQVHFVPDLTLLAALSISVATACGFDT
jgi:hypothetical protein